MESMRSISLSLLVNASSQSSLSTDTNSSSSYSSGSAMTTPSDEEPPGPSFRTTGAAFQAKAGILQTSNSKPRLLSTALKSAKRIAHNLVPFRQTKMRPRRESTGSADVPQMIMSRNWHIIAPTARLSIKKYPAGRDANFRFYSLPNRCLSTFDKDEFVKDYALKQRRTVNPRNQASLATSPKLLRDLFLTPEKQDDCVSKSRAAVQAVVPTESPQTVECSVDAFKLDVSSILATVIRVICFVPWCVAVGGTLVLFPRQLEFVTFAPGYLRSISGIRRFAHWANCGMEHIMIFLAFIGLIIWCDTSIGLPVTLAALARFTLVWGGFQVDKTIPLGDDDQQSLYLITMGLASNGDQVIVRGSKGLHTIIISDEDM